MFTGIVEAAVPVAAVTATQHSLALTLDLGPCADGVRPGDSISVRGCCLTVERIGGTLARFHLMAQTLSLTAFGGLVAGSRVNVERSLRVGDRLGGHFVSGHLDGVGSVTARRDAPGQTDLTFGLPGELARLCVPKGSIAIDGVSLTVARATSDSVTVCLIPHTLAVTTLGELTVGDAVHLEMDLIGKWVARLMRPE